MAGMLVTEQLVLATEKALALKFVTVMIQQTHKIKLGTLNIRQNLKKLSKMPLS
jgi:hypothetical protein